MSAWLASLGEREASFLGSLIGPAIGLIALVLGALYNARLNRRRDDRLRAADARSTAAALKAELVGLQRALVENAEVLNDAEADFLMPDLAESIRVLPGVLSRIGFLDSETVQTVIAAYVTVEQHADRLLLLGGVLNQRVPMKQRMIALPNAKAQHVRILNQNASKTIERAIGSLDTYLT